MFRMHYKNQPPTFWLQMTQEDMFVYPNLRYPDSNRLPYCTTVDKA